MVDDQPVTDSNVPGSHGEVRVDRAGETVAVDSRGRQAMKSVMASPGAAREVPETHPASRLYRVFTGLFVFGPPALLVAAFRKRRFWATRTNRRIFGAFYISSGLGITAGYHRLFTHRSFKTYPLIRGVFAVLGSTRSRGQRRTGWRTIASTMPTPTKRAIPTVPMWATRAAGSGVSFMLTSAGCSPTRRHRGSATSPICWTIRS